MQECIDKGPTVDIFLQHQSWHRCVDSIRAFQLSKCFLSNKQSDVVVYDHVYRHASDSAQIERFVQDASRTTIYTIAAGALFVNLYLGHFRHVGTIYDEGYGMTNFICMYLLGVWLRKEGVNLVRRLSKARIWLVLAIICVMAIQYKAIAWVSWTGLILYSSPYCIVMSVLVFLLFVNFTPPESLRKPILFFSSSAISVYLVTDYPAIRKIWESLFASAYLSCISSVMELSLILFSTIIAFIISCLIDKVRIPVTNYAKERIINIIG